MINYLCGIPKRHERDGSLTFIVSGVGYRVHVGDRDRPAFTIAGDADHPVEIHVRHVIKEESQTLYGFADERDRRAFDRMVACQGIGPAKALRILSAKTVDQLMVIAQTGALEDLERIPGVARKTAEAIVAGLLR